MIAFLKEIAADPDNDALYLVLGDHLQSIGDPRGELISIQHALRTADPTAAADFMRREAALLDTHFDWFGDLREHSESLRIEWRNGFIARAWASTKDAVRAVIDHASLTLAELRVTDQETLDEVLANPPTALRRLHAGEINIHNRTAAIELRAMPPLDELVVTASQIALAWTEAPRIRRIVLRGKSKLPSFAWPELQELVLAEVGPPALRALDAAKFPLLHALGLTFTKDTDEVIAALIDAPILPQLRSIDLRCGTATAAGIKKLVTRGKTLDLRGNYITSKKLDVGPQRTLGKGDDALSLVSKKAIADLVEQAGTLVTKGKLDDKAHARIAAIYDILELVSPHYADVREGHAHRLPKLDACALVENIAATSRRAFIPVRHHLYSAWALKLDELGEMPRAEILLWHAIRQARWSDNEDNEINALSHVATLRMRRGDPSAARPILARIADYHIENKNSYQLPWVRRQQGNVELVASDYPAAERFYTEALALYKARNDTANEAIVMSELAGVYWSRQEYESAVQLLKDSIELRGDDALSSGSVYYNLGALYNGMHRIADSREAAEKSLEIFAKAGHRHGMGMARSLLGELAQRVNEHGKAVELLEAALADHRGAGAQRETGISLGNLGRVHLDLGDYAKARECFEEAVEIHREVGNKFNEGMQLMDLGRALIGANELAGAHRAFEESLVPFKAIANHPGIAAVEFYRGAAHHLANDRDVAAEDYRASAISAEKAKSQDQVASAELGLSLVAHHAGDRAEAERLYAAADKRSSHDIHDVECLSTVRAILDGKPLPAVIGYSARLYARLEPTNKR